MLNGFLLARQIARIRAFSSGQPPAAGQMALAGLSLGLEGGFWVCCSFPCGERINPFRRCGPRSPFCSCGRKEGPRCCAGNQGLPGPRAWSEFSLSPSESCRISLLREEGRNITHPRKADVFLWANKRVSVLSLLAQPGHCVAKGV